MDEVRMKTCVKCGIEKPETKFYFTGRSRKYRKNSCSACDYLRNQLAAEKYTPEQREIRRQQKLTAHRKWKQNDPVNAIYCYTEVRSRNAGIPITVTLRHLRDLWTQQAGRCAMTGLLFTDCKSGTRTGPFRPSLDRINSDAGYVEGNVRFVLWSINQALGEFGEVVLDQIANARLWHKCLTSPPVSVNGSTDEENLCSH